MPDPGVDVTASAVPAADRVQLPEAGEPLVSASALPKDWTTAPVFVTRGTE